MPESFFQGSEQLWNRSTEQAALCARYGVRAPMTLSTDDLPEVILRLELREESSFVLQDGTCSDFLCGPPQSGGKAFQHLKALVAMRTWERL